MSYNILPEQLPLFKRRHPMRHLMLGFYQQKQTSVTGGNINSSNWILTLPNLKQFFTQLHTHLQTTKTFLSSFLFEAKETRYKRKYASLIGDRFQWLRVICYVGTDWAYTERTVWRAEMRLMTGILATTLSSS
jgi:hypothetical protein